MKRIIPAVIIALVIIASFLGSYYYVNNICDTAYNEVQKSLEEYKKNGTAEFNSEKLKSFWDEKEKILSFFVNHELIDKIELSISNLHLHSKFENNYMFYEACDTVKILLHQVIEDTKLTTHSVF